MKKSSHPSTSKKKASPSPKEIAPLDEPLVSDNPVDETNLAVDQFAVVAREEEATSSGGRVEPIEGDDEQIAENLIEEGLQGYMHGSLRKPRKTK